MSGPKIDVAELRRREKERLEKARRNRLDAAEKIRRLMLRLEESTAALVSALSGEPSFGDDIKFLRDKKDKYLKALEGLKRLLQNGNETLEADKILSEAQSAFSAFERETESVTARVRAYIAEKDRFAEDKKARDMQSGFKRLTVNREALTRTSVDSTAEIQEDVDIKTESEFIMADIESAMGIAVNKRQMDSFQALGRELTDILESDISDSRKAKRLHELHESFKLLCGTIGDEAEAMRAAYDEYIAECFDLDSPPVELKEFSSAREIEEAVAAAKELAEKRLAKEYIRRQIDEVMAKHGYDVIKSDLLREATDKGQILYEVDDDTAIDVFVSDDSQVTMRVVGIGFDSDISQAEDDALYEKQCAFCSMHPQITKELELRGVILRTKAHMPPHKKYNKKIKVQDKKNGSTESRAKKELKRTELKKKAQGVGE